jgi:hypothetical protein
MRRKEGCEHSDGVIIGREGGRCRVRCLICGSVGPPREDFEAALRSLQEHHERPVLAAAVPLKRHPRRSRRAYEATG